MLDRWHLSAKVPEDYFSTLAPGLDNGYCMHGTLNKSMVLLVFSARWNKLQLSFQIAAMYIGIQQMRMISVRVKHI